MLCLVVMSEAGSLMVHIWGSGLTVMSEVVIVTTGDLSRTVGHSGDTLVGEMKELLPKALKMSVGSDSMVHYHSLR